MTGLLLLNALLILLGPFLVVGPLAAAARVQFAPAGRGHRRPAARVRAGGWAVAL